MHRAPAARVPPDPGRRAPERRPLLRPRLRPRNLVHRRWSSCRRVARAGAPPRRARGPAAPARRIRIAGAVGDALAHAHARRRHPWRRQAGQRLHDRGPATPRLLDFGVAPESVDEPAKRRRPWRAAATRVYASPEVLAGEDPEPRDDVFSLACVTYEMLAGVHPYGRRGADTAPREGTRAAAGSPARWRALAGPRRRAGRRERDRRAPRHGGIRARAPRRGRPAQPPRACLPAVAPVAAAVAPHRPRRERRIRLRRGAPCRGARADQAGRSSRPALALLLGILHRPPRHSMPRTRSATAPPPQARMPLPLTAARAAAELAGRRSPSSPRQARRREVAVAAPSPYGPARARLLRLARAWS